MKKYICIRRSFKLLLVLFGNFIFFVDQKIGFLKRGTMFLTHQSVLKNMVQHNTQYVLSIGTFLTYIFIYTFHIFVLKFLRYSFGIHLHSFMRELHFKHVSFVQLKPIWAYCVLRLTLVILQVKRQRPNYLLVINHILHLVVVLRVIVEQGLGNRFWYPVFRYVVMM